MRIRVTGKSQFAARAATAAIAVPLLLASAAPASAAPSSDSTQLSAAALPAELVTAIRRDLKMSPEEYLRRSADAQKLAGYARKFRADHPGQYSGAWIAKDGRAVIGVTTADAAKTAAADGFQTAMTSVSADGLEQSLNQLTAWFRGLPQNIAAQVGAFAIDALDNQIVVSIANSPIGQVLNLPTLLAKVKVVLAPGTVGPVSHRPMGGDTYISSTKPLGPGKQVITICSFGFNAVDAHGTPLNVSAGHCDPNAGKPGSSAPVYVPNVRSIQDSPQAGVFAKSRIGAPSQLDYSLIQLNARAVRNDMDKPRVRGADGKTVNLTGIADPVVGAPVCKSGQSSTFTCGLIRADQVQTNLVTDDGSSKVVRGFATSTCTLSGDSGGSIITGTLALGITSGSNASQSQNCNQANLSLAMDGGTQSLGIPVTRILADANATAGGGVGTGLRIRTLSQP